MPDNHKQLVERLLSDGALDAAGRTGLPDGEWDLQSEPRRTEERVEWRAGIKAALQHAQEQVERDGS